MLRIGAHRDAGCDLGHCANEISEFELNSGANDLGTLGKFISIAEIELTRLKK